MSSNVIPDTSTFPVDWHNAEDAGGTFWFDPMHFPFPAAPLEQSTMSPCFSAGYAAAAREMRLPVLRFEITYRNHYRFERLVRTEPANEAETTGMGEVAESPITLEMGRLIERWYGEHLPAISAHLARLRAMDARSGSGADAVALMAEADAIQRSLWTIHFRIAFPMLQAMQVFDEFHADLFGGSEADAHALLVGAMSESVKAGFGLSDLGAFARSLGLDDVFLTTPANALMPALRTAPGGQEFLALLDAYLEDYGFRQDLIQFTIPTWRENPSIALSGIRNYVETRRDARAEHEAIAQTAESALDAAREKIATYPEAVRTQFETMLQFARHGSFLQEEHNFYIDQQGVALLRLFYLTVGDRLVEDGILTTRDDVFMLTTDEIRSFLTAADPRAYAQGAHSLVQARAEEMDIARGLVPPSFIGETPVGSPPAGDPSARAIVRFFGGPPQQATEPDQIKGNPGSRGVATGMARVVRTLDEATSLLPGEILVAVTTMPPWTPLFGVAAAVVTETGGVLSHCAIVAREYGIPAIVGAHGATRAIVTGQRITVDGTTGTVTIHS
jgi:rifampicin phosphotransferase